MVQPEQTWSTSGSPPGVALRHQVWYDNVQENNKRAVEIHIYS